MKKQIIILFTTFLAATTAYSTPNIKSFKDIFEEGFDMGYKAGYVDACNAINPKEPFFKGFVLGKGENIYSKIGLKEAKKLINDLSINPSNLSIGFCAVKRHENSNWEYCTLDDIVKIKKW